jgi:hypothetical protein
MRSCRQLIGSDDGEASLAPDDHPDVWLKGPVVSAGDIACLNVDASNSFCDLVLDQGNRARLPAVSVTHAWTVRGVVAL